MAGFMRRFLCWLGVHKMSPTVSYPTTSHPENAVRFMSCDFCNKRGRLTEEQVDG